MFYALLGSTVDTCACFGSGGFGRIPHILPYAHGHCSARSWNLAPTCSVLVSLEEYKKIVLAGRWLSKYAGWSNCGYTLMRQSTELENLHVFLREGGRRIPRSIPACCSHLDMWTFFQRSFASGSHSVSPRRQLEDFHTFSTRIPVCVAVTMQRQLPAVRRDSGRCLRSVHRLGSMTISRRVGHFLPHVAAFFRLRPSGR